MSDPALPSDSPPGTLEPMPPPADRPDPGTDRPEAEYRPLSLLSLLGFGLAVSYAAVMVVLTIAALVLNKPALAPFWTLLIPVLAIVVCLLGRIEIARAENTLAGRSLTTWGMGLCVLVSLSHFAYMLAVYLTLRQQAEAFAREWMEQAREGQTTRAALLTLPPGKRLSMENITDPEELGREIDLQMSQADKAAPPHYTRIVRHNDLVRMLGEAGPDATITFKGVSSWEYVRNAYEVTLTYRIDTPELSFDAVVVVQGVEADNDEFRGRQWYVDVRRTGLPREPQTPTAVTNRGLRASEVGQGSSIFVQQWLRKLSEYEAGLAFLDTRPPSERETLREHVSQELAVGAAMGAAASVVRSEETGVYPFLAGGFVGADEQQFSDPSRKPYLEKARRAFGTPPHAAGNLQLSLERPAPRRVVDKDTGRLRYIYDVHYIVAPKEMLSGELVIETSAGVLDQPAGTPVQRQIKSLTFHNVESRTDLPPGG